MSSIKFQPQTRSVGQINDMYPSASLSIYMYVSVSMYRSSQVLYFVGHFEHNYNYEQVCLQHFPACCSCSLPVFVIAVVVGQTGCSAFLAGRWDHKFKIKLQCRWRISLSLLFHYAAVSVLGFALLYLQYIRTAALTAANSENCSSPNCERWEWDIYCHYIITHYQDK